MMPSEGITIRLKRTTAALSNNDLNNYEIVYGEPLYFDNASGQFLAIGDNDSSTAANAYLVKLVPRQVTVGSGASATNVPIAPNPVFYKILNKNDNAAVAIIKDDGTEIYPLTTLDQVIDTTTGSSVSLSALLAKKVDVDIIEGEALTAKIGIGVDSGGIYAVYNTFEIVEEPVDYYGQIGDTATFTVVATGAGLTYQWQFHNGTKWLTSTSTGAKTATLSVEMTEARLAYQYRCIVRDTHGESLTSNAVRMIVSPSIVEQPWDVTASADTVVVFSVVAQGEGDALTYQWQYSADSGNTWANSTYSSATTATLHITALARFSGYLYHCVVTDGAGRSVTSDAAMLTVQ